MRGSHQSDILQEKGGSLLTTLGRMLDEPYSTVPLLFDSRREFYWPSTKVNVKLSGQRPHNGIGQAFQVGNVGYFAAQMFGDRTLSACVCILLLRIIQSIRRGIPNVIIIDAEHDPKYGFGAYKILKSRLAADGITLVSKELEATIGSRPPKSIFTAVAAGDRASIKIYYIKTSLPKSLDTLLEQQSQPNSNGQRAQQDFESALINSGAGSKKWNCQNLRAQSLKMEAWSAYNAGRYAAYLHDRDGTATVFNATGIGALALKFPHYTTVDQSFYVDQARAFIGLGYLQASELSDAI